MRFRKLRIAWSVAWGLAALLLIVLWVRSYSWCDTLYWNGGNPELISLGGKFQIGGQFMVAVPPMPPPVFQGGIGTILVLSLPVTTDAKSPTSLLPTPNLTLPESNVALGQFAAFSDAWILLLFGIVTAVPWFRTPTRFSLRTLLIATTLIATATGLLVWAVR